MISWSCSKMIWPKWLFPISTFLQVDICFIFVKIFLIKKIRPRYKLPNSSNIGENIVWIQIAEYFDVEYGPASCPGEYTVVETPGLVQHVSSQDTYHVRWVSVMRHLLSKYLEICQQWGYPHVLMTSEWGHGGQGVPRDLSFEHTLTFLEESINVF